MIGARQVLTSLTVYVMCVWAAAMADADAGGQDVPSTTAGDIAEHHAPVSGTPASVEKKAGHELPASTQPEASTQPDMLERTFKIPIQRGQYVFIGIDKGLKAANDWDRGVWYVSKVQVSADSKAVKWDLHITVRSRVDSEDHISVYEWRAALRKEVRPGLMREATTMSWTVSVPDGSAVAIDQLKLLRAKAGNGLDRQQIAYEDMDGEVHYILIAVANTRDAFAPAISIAKRFFIFDWTAWTKVE